MFINKYIFNCESLSPNNNKLHKLFKTTQELVVMNSDKIISLKMCNLGDFKRKIHSDKQLFSALIQNFNCICNKIRRIVTGYKFISQYGEKIRN